MYLKELFSSHNNRTTYLIIGGIVVVVIAIIVGVVIGSMVNKQISPLQEIPLRDEVPSDIVVPDQNASATNTPKDIAIPKVSIPAAPGVSATLRVFDITAKENTFTPPTIAAYSGDTVHINFTATDKAYDIIFPDYNMKQTAQKGETKVLEFQAQATGKFTYFCELCGGVQSKAIGYIIVAPKKTP